MEITRETDKQKNCNLKQNRVSEKEKEKANTEETATEQKEDDKHWRNLRNSPSTAPDTIKSYNFCQYCMCGPQTCQSS